jgi:hypothetical protein
MLTPHSISLDTTEGEQEQHGERTYPCRSQTPNTANYLRQSKPMKEILTSYRTTSACT